VTGKFLKKHSFSLPPPAASAAAYDFITLVAALVAVELGVCALPKPHPHVWVITLSNYEACLVQRWGRRRRGRGWGGGAVFSLLITRSCSLVLAVLRFARKNSRAKTGKICSCKLPLCGNFYKLHSCVVRSFMFSLLHEDERLTNSYDRLILGYVACVYYLPLHSADNLQATRLLWLKRHRCDNRKV